MPAESSFDIVSRIDRQEVDNALNQAAREIGTRFDFLPIDAAHDVERRLGGHRCSFSGRVLTDGQEVTAPRRGAGPGRSVAG